MSGMTDEMAETFVDDMEIELERKQFLNTCVGISEQVVRERVEEQGGVVRIVSVNGTPRVTTRDFNVNRLNLSVVDGKVNRAYFG